MLEFSRKVGILGESWQAMLSFFLKLARKDRDIPFLQVSASPAIKETDIKKLTFFGQKNFVYKKDIYLFTWLSGNSSKVHIFCCLKTFSKTDQGALPICFSKYWDLAKIGISHIFKDFRAPEGTWNPYILPEIQIFAWNPPKSAKSQF